MKTISQFLLGVLLVGTVWGQLHAQQSAREEAEWMSKLRASIDEALAVATQGQLEVDRVEETPMEGLLQVTLNSGEVLYSDRSGQFLVTGDLFMTSSSGLVNLSAQQRVAQNSERIAAIPAEQMISFTPDEVRATVTVFTDVDCTYCRRLHLDIDEILSHDVEVRYLAYPRGGMESAAYQKMVSVWCANDRERAITQAKHGQNVPQADCEHPVMEHFSLGNQLGITGTPAVVLPDGSIMPGYLDVERLVSAALGQ